jgi:hypothetical protein
MNRSQTFHGQAKLTQCTVGRCDAGPAEQVMPPERRGAVQVVESATADMQQCYMEVSAGIFDRKSTVCCPTRCW